MPKCVKKRNSPNNHCREDVKNLRDTCRARQDQLLKLLPPRHVAIVASGNAPKNWRNNFVPNGNFLYLTGLNYPDTIAVFGAADSRYVLFWKEPLPHEAIWTGMRMSSQEAQHLAGADKVLPLKEFPAQIAEYLKGASGLACTLGSDDKLDLLILEARQQLLAQRSISTIAPAAIVDLGRFVEKIRLFKDKGEIETIRKAIDITGTAYRLAFEAARPGMYEYEIEALVHYVFRKHGAQGQGFPTIVASGSNSTVLHYTSNDRRMQKRELLLVDCGARYENYSADVTRTWPLGGKFNARQQLVYQAVLSTEEEIIKQVRPGITAIDIHQKTVERLTRWMLELGLLHGKLEDAVANKDYEKYFPHKTSHWLGLDVHDAGGYYNDGDPAVLEAGMVLTIEPGIYVRPGPDTPEKFAGIGVRIEDDVLVTADGCEVLTASIPKRVEDMENLAGAKS